MIFYIFRLILICSCVIYIAELNNWKSSIEYVLNSNSVLCDLKSHHGQLFEIWEIWSLFIYVCVIGTKSYNFRREGGILFLVEYKFTLENIEFLEEIRMYFQNEVKVSKPCPQLLR